MTQQSDHNAPLASIAALNIADTIYVMLSALTGSERRMMVALEARKHLAIALTHMSDAIVDEITAAIRKGEDK